MDRRRRLAVLGVFAAAAVAGLGGCAAPGAPFATLDPVAPGRGHLYVYRKPALYAFGAKYKVAVDGAPAGELPNASYLVLPLSPGRHTLTVDEGGFARPKTVDVNVEAGRNHFVEYDSSKGLLLGWGLLSGTTARSETEALADLKGLNRAN
ncbi:MAG TPA: DUF2846 domain-containing protein [Ramlibacter sp.]|jgi:hypothetical protein|nr:DUF2846 domain-containing protein [Ramlibacter sp.]